MLQNIGNIIYYKVKSFTKNYNLTTEKIQTF